MHHSDVLLVGPATPVRGCLQNIHGEADIPCHAGELGGEVGVLPRTRGRCLDIFHDEVGEGPPHDREAHKPPQATMR